MGAVCNLRVDDEVSILEGSECLFSVLPLCSPMRHPKDGAGTPLSNNPKDRDESWKSAME